MPDPKKKHSALCPGQWVILLDRLHPSKFKPKLPSQPHIVINREGHGNFLVCKPSNQAKYTRHEDDLKEVPDTTLTPFRANPAPFSVPLWISDQGRGTEVQTGLASPKPNHH